MGMALPNEAERVVVPPCCTSHAMQRHKIGPTGHKHWMIIVNSCYRCGIIEPAQPLTWEQHEWVHRWNPGFF